KYRGSCVRNCSGTSTLSERTTLSEESKIAAIPPAFCVSIASASMSGTVCFPPVITTTSPGLTATDAVTMRWASRSTFPCWAAAAERAADTGAMLRAKRSARPRSNVCCMGPVPFGRGGQIAATRRSGSLRTSGGAPVPHVGTAAAGNWPRRHDASGPRVEHADGPRPAPSAGGRVPAAVRDVHEAPVAARIDPVRPPSGRDEPEAAESRGVHQVHTVRLHVGDVEHPAVRGRADVLRHARAVQSPGVEGEVADDGAGLEIDLHELPRELAGRDREPPVPCEFHVVHTLAPQRD